MIKYTYPTNFGALILKMSLILSKLSIFTVPKRLTDPKIYALNLIFGF